MKSSELISIITPAYNAAPYLAETINSVLHQTYPNWELIIVDDDSTDNTSEVVQFFLKKDLRIRFFTQKNGKQGRARNRGIEEAKGKYIAFLDADDLWLPNKLERQLNDLVTNNVDLVFNHAYLIQGQIRTSETIGYGKGCYQGNETLLLLLEKNRIVISTVITKREVLYSVDLFETDVKIQYCEDWHLWLNLALRGFTFYSDGSPNSFYRIHAASAAKVEQNAPIKIFYSFLKLCLKYPNHLLLNEETKKRGLNIVFNSKVLTTELIKALLFFFYPKGGIVSNLLDATSQFNIKLFRKLFLLINRK